jgi:NTE family protein
MSEDRKMFGQKFRQDIQDTAPADKARRRKPVIGLALGGGSARGWAHIGILRELDRHGIRPEIVVGTSIGAVVGGCWAAGKLNELETFARGMTRRSMIGWMDINFAGSGFLSGDRLRKGLEEHFQGTLIEDLPVRFAAVATELRTGHEVWLTRGNVTDAMRASYALPGIFSPVQIAGRWFIDGAFTNPIPVGVARALGAEIIIAVNLHTDVLGRSGVIHEFGGSDPGVAALPPKQQDDARRGFFANLRRPFARAAQPEDKPSAPPGIGAIMLDAFNITQDRMSKARLQGDPPDVTIKPKIGGIGLSEFHRAAESIAAGEVAAAKVAADIQELIEGLTRVNGS